MSFKQSLISLLKKSDRSKSDSDATDKGRSSSLKESLRGFSLKDQATEQFNLAKRKERRIKEMEEIFNENLKYILNIKDSETTVLDSKYLKKMQYIVDNLERYGYTNPNLITFMEYPKIPEQFILLIAEYLSCHQMSVVEYYGRKQIELFTAHLDHPLVYCLKGHDIFYNSLICVLYASESDLFNRIFNQKEGVSLYLKYIQNEEFISDCLLVSEVGSKKEFNILHLLQVILQTLLNFTRSIEMSEYKTHLLKFTDLVNQRKLQNLFLLSFMTLVRIVNEREKIMIPDFQQFIKLLTQFLSAASGAIKSKTHLTKMVLKDGVYVHVTVVELNDLSLDIIELLEIAFNLESFEYDRLVFFDHLRLIFLNGTDTELEYAVKLMLQYSFKYDLREFMAADEMFKASLKRIIMYDYPNKRLLKYCDGLLWRLASHVENKTNSKLSFASSGFTEPVDPFCYNFKSFNKLIGKKVFISHEIYDNFMCRKIQTELKSFGLEALLNNEKSLEEYRFEKVSGEIKNSDVVLICLSQRYKNNISNRLEVDFAIENGKPILPVIMQKDYVLDGWLEEAIKNIDCLEFAMDSFEQSIEKVLNGINFYLIVDEL